MWGVCFFVYDVDIFFHYMTVYTTAWVIHLYRLSHSPYSGILLSWSLTAMNVSEKEWNSRFTLHKKSTFGCILSPKKRLTSSLSLVSVAARRLHVLSIFNHLQRPKFLFTFAWGRKRTWTAHMYDINLYTTCRAHAHVHYGFLFTWTWCI